MPNRFNPVNQRASLPQVINQFNQNMRKLDQEAVTKKFGQGVNQVIIGKAGERAGMVVGDLAGDAIIYGRYSDERFGTLRLEGGVPVALSGQHPVTGKQGEWIVSTGRNVIEELGGSW